MIKAEFKNNGDIRKFFCGIIKFIEGRKIYWATNTNAKLCVLTVQEFKYLLDVIKLEIALDSISCLTIEKAAEF